LGKARNSSFKPFPPQNAYLEIDFSNFHEPTPEDIRSAIRQTIEFQLNPPIKNLGVKGMRLTSKELLKWPDFFKEYDLRMNLFSLYIFIEIGGTGGGCFRYMYSRFLKESAEILKDDRLMISSEKMEKSGKLFSEIGMMFKEAETADDLPERIKKASHSFHEIADIEEDTLRELSAFIQ
jgi:hypothetical protein